MIELNIQNKYIPTDICNIIFDYSFNKSKNNYWINTKHGKIIKEDGHYLFIYSDYIINFYKIFCYNTIC